MLLMPVSCSLAASPQAMLMTVHLSRTWSKSCLANSLATKVIFHNPCMTNCLPKTCSSSPSYDATCKTNSCHAWIRSCCASEPSLRPLWTNSRISHRLSIRVIAAFSTCWAISSLVSLPTRGGRPSPRSVSVRMTCWFPLFFSFLTSN